MSRITFLGRIPMTRVRLLIAQVLYRLLHSILREDIHLIRRKGVCYEVDLAEGVDLSLFLLGRFQGHIANNKYLSFADDAIILDVGANFGSMTFRFAQLAPQGHVYAFEPTDYAFKKLLTNLSLNPALAPRVTAVQTFVSDETKTEHQLSAYASWKVDGSASQAHPWHGGTIKSAESVPTVTIDDFCLQKGIQKVDLVKIDTDGHELLVLKGAARILEESQPFIVFEAGLYIMQERGTSFEEYYSYLTSYHYHLFNAKNDKKITLGNFADQIPMRSTTDIVAVPQKPRPIQKEYLIT